jgi:hypothetical protein
VKIEGYTLGGAKLKLRSGKKSINEPNQEDIVLMLEQIKKELLSVQEAL